MRSVADADFVRRQNRLLLLSTLRRHGAMSRTQLATTSGLSSASITAIGGELIGQAVLAETGAIATIGLRGRPAVEVALNRRAAYAVIIEIDVNRIRSSLADYAGLLVDRTELSVTPELFATAAAAAVISERVSHLKRRNPEETVSLRAISVSVQGVLDRESEGLKWSPIPKMAGQNLVAPLRESFGVPVTLHKRGRLLAEGARLLYPELGDVPLAAMFIGSTVAMGLSLTPRGSADAGATEFGHMNHQPGGALCRCGQKGCIEAYAADYGVLRTAYGVPDQVLPASAVPAPAYQELLHLAQTGRRNALHAFNVAGRAIGYGLGRLLAIAAPSHVVITGPGAAAFPMMRPELETALRDSLVVRISGPPTITVHHDEREPIFQGMLMDTLASIDESFAATVVSPSRVSSAR